MIRIREVGPRDGLQDIARFVPSDDKVRLIDALAAAGLREINATSCVSPKWVPQLADAEDVMGRITRRAGTRYTITVPNEHGAVRALAARADGIGLPLSASETFQRRNLNATTEETLARLGPIIALVRAQAPGCEVGAGVSMAFGCPFEGAVDPARVAEVAARAVALGVSALALGDTTGTADPRQVRRVLAATRAAVGPSVRLYAHFHDSRGLGLANALAALDAGCDGIDASVGGMGGCPYAPDAGGNIATEDLVQMLEAMGVATGVDLDALIACARLAEEITHETLPGQVMRAGRIPFCNPA
ncbi:MAG: hydroxymethylglutaryl-CoA lyase [Myxococcales bacterium]|nr:hydroxymethylglutaryl-CoA lyase [Myxococcales bacterium]